MIAQNMGNFQAIKGWIGIEPFHASSAQGPASMIIGLRNLSARAKDEANGRIIHLQASAQLMNKKPIICGCHPAGKIDEYGKRWRRGLGLRRVIKLHLVTLERRRRVLSHQVL